MLALILLLCLASDLHLTIKYGGVDLRDKIVGTRGLLNGTSMYFDTWRPGMPEELADPMVPPGYDLTRFTGSPFQALIMAPFAPLPYPFTRILWTFIQYGLLLWSALILYGSLGRNDPRALTFTIGAVAVFAVTTAWRLHVERGQVYVIHTLLVALMYFSVIRGKHILTGAAGAALCLIKPTFALLLLPLLFAFDRRMIAGGLSMIIPVAAIFSILPAGWHSWSEYAEAMRIYVEAPVYAADVPETPRPFEYPPLIEGASNLADHHTMEAENSSITILLMHLGSPLPTQLPPAIVLLITGSIFLFGWKRLRYLTPADLLLLGFLLTTISMMLAPALRFSYQFVLWLPSLLYLLLVKKHPAWWYIALATSGLLITGGLELLPIGALLAEVILLGLAATYLWTISSERRASRTSAPDPSATYSM